MTISPPVFLSEIHHKMKTALVSGGTSKWNVKKKQEGREVKLIKRKQSFHLVWCQVVSERQQYWKTSRRHCGTLYLQATGKVIVPIATVRFGGGLVSFAPDCFSVVGWMLWRAVQLYCVCGQCDQRAHYCAIAFQPLDFHCPLISMHGPGTFKWIKIQD